MPSPRIRVTVAARDDGWACRAEIEDPRGASSHLVQVTAADLRRYGRGRAPEELVQASLKFLLQREPPGAILAAFSLSDIEHYFPDFPEVV